MSNPINEGINITKTSNKTRSLDEQELPNVNFAGISQNTCISIRSREVVR